MAVCRNCERVLSANGSCLFCGTLQGMEAAKKGKARRVSWLKRILLITILAWFIHFFFISATGRGIVRPLFDKIGLSNYISL